MHEQRSGDGPAHWWAWEGGAEIEAAPGNWEQAGGGDLPVQSCQKKSREKMTRPVIRVMVIVTVTVMARTPERRRRARQAQRKRGILTSARSFSLAWPLKHDRSGCGAKHAAAPPAAGLRQRAVAGVTGRLAQLVKRFCSSINNSARHGVLF